MLFSFVYHVQVHEPSNYFYGVQICGSIWASGSLCKSSCSGYLISGQVFLWSVDSRCGTVTGSECKTMCLSWQKEAIPCNIHVVYYLTLSCYICYYIGGSDKRPQKKKTSVSVSPLKLSFVQGTYNIIQLVTTFSDTPWHTHSSSYFYECCEALSEIHRPFPALSHCETRTFSATLRLEGSWMQPRFHLTHYGKDLEKDRSYLHIW